MGTFTVGESKVRPGIYHRYENGGGVAAAGAVNGIGAGLIKANWGPLNEVVEFDATTDVNEIFGSGKTEDLITAMFEGGISTGKFVRIGNGGTAPTVTLQTTESADAVKITGAYVGTRAFSVTVRDALSGEGKELFIFDGAKTFLKVEIPTADDEIPAVVEAINSATKHFVATAVAEASGKLANVAQKAMTGGTDPSVTTSEYSTGLGVLEACVFNCLVVDTSEVAVHALVNAFLERAYSTGMYPMACIAETKDIDLDTRIGRAASYNNEMLCYVLNSAYDMTGKLLDGYINAAKIGGMIASVSSGASLTHQTVTNYSAVGEALTNTQIEKALKNGCLVLTQNASGQVWVEQGINTLVTPNGEQDAGWKKIRRVKTRFELMQRIDNTLDVLVGKINNDTDGRAALIAAGQSVIDTMVGEKKILAGSTFSEDPNMKSAGDSAHFLIAVDDIDSIEKVYLTYRFRFSAS